MNRKQRRSIQKHAGRDATQELSDKVFLFNKMPTSCSACDKEFDKTNKDMLNSWNVVVKQEVVRLFCPDCIEKTRDTLENLGLTKNENEETEQK